jgi:ABC-type cobalamin/Fe3+-siderophores transport system ATPase subunit
MVQGGDVWLLDEPLAHLDLKRQAAILALLKSESQRRTVLLTLHEPHWARLHADRLLLLHADGRWEAGGSELAAPERLAALYGVAPDEIPFGKGRNPAPLENPPA